MNPREKSQITATGRSEMIALLPVADRAEVVGQSLALSAGANVPHAEINPLSEALLRGGMNFAKVMNALGLPVSAGYSHSDLRQSFDEALKVILVDAIRTRDTAHRQICRMFALPNFLEAGVPWPQPVSLTRMGEAGEVPPVQPGMRWEQTAQVETFAGMVHFTRAAILGAEWSLLKSTAEELLDAAFRAEREAIFAMLVSNPNLANGTPWFDASRNNVAPGATGITAASLGTAVSMLRGLADGGARALNLKPRFIVVPAGHEVAVSTLVEATSEATFQKSKEPIVASTELDGANWWLLPSPDARPVIGLGHIGTATEPVVDTRPEFKSDAVGIRVRHDFGVCPLSPHGIMSPILPA
jgi:hypothetical protein